MYVKVYKLIGDQNVYQKTIHMEPTTANMRMICINRYVNTNITMQVTGIHNQAKFIRISNKYNKVKI